MTYTSIGPTRTTYHNTKPSTEADIELVSFSLCPYVQRAIIVLDEKGIAHRRKYIDLSNKPDWFKQISPLGKVPLLKTEQGVLFESSVISEYLDEVTENSIHPENPFTKALHRSWIEFGSTILAGIAGLYSAKDQNTYYEKRETLVQKFELLERQLDESTYFASDELQLVDAVYGPIFRYFDILETFIRFDFFEDLPKVKRYRENLLQRPSVIQAVPQDYQELLIQFLINKRSYLSGLIPQKAAE
ncbi:glutathione S-transferase family protein [Kiloniella sp.]|uniref:glutathione S-transferase family protein n=1 Tax=Kiloniella sp. TaxID=1938587 RepID=UPI003B01BF55